MDVRVYGTGCPNCRRLEARAREALSAMGAAVEVTKVEDLGMIADAGVLRTPALGIDGSVVMQGRVPEVNELAEIFAAALAR